MNPGTLQQRLRDAADSATALRLRGGGTKDFYGGALRGEVLDLRGYAGVVSYEPTELVVTARCGTRLAELESVLAEKRQTLPFEPPHFGALATLGGCVAAGLSGPRRATAGALRDYVLGVKLLDGRGRLLEFGGQVMKNVAGYDVARLVAGSLGTLGIIAEASLKVLPVAPEESSRVLETDQRGAIEMLNRWAGQPLPISATAWHAGRLHLRLSGAAAAVRAAEQALGGEPLEDGAAFWSAVREHAHPFFADPAPLWRIAVPSVTVPLELRGPQLIEWGGALRWLVSAEEPEVIRDVARRAKGHATLFRAREKRAPVFTPLEPALLRIHRALKASFDPAGILNPGRLYPEL